MISERVLKRWRKEALKYLEERRLTPDVLGGNHAKLANEFSARILTLTQELLDQHLLRKE